MYLCLVSLTGLAPERLSAMAICVGNVGSLFLIPRPNAVLLMNASANGLNLPPGASGQ